MLGSGGKEREREKVGILYSSFSSLLPDELVKRVVRKKEELPELGERERGEEEEELTHLISLYLSHHSCYYYC